MSTKTITWIKIVVEIRLVLIPGQNKGIAWLLCLSLSHLT